MKTYYQGENARHYNQQWRTFTKRTLTPVLSQVKMAVPLLPVQQCRLHILDVACGTGTLLKRIAEYFPDAELFGVDASPDMLVQAKQTLALQPHVHLERMDVGRGKQTHLPYAPESFDVITCTNALHLMKEPVETLIQFKTLLTRDGFLILEDYSRRPPPFPWSLFEFVLRNTEETYVRAYTLSEVQTLCTQANLQFVSGHAFSIDWLWRGWVITAKVKTL